MDPGGGDRNAAREPMAEPAALPWGMDKAEVQKSSLTDLTDEKLARFVIGQQKKTKFEKEREEREIKKRKADEEAAAMYAKFVASFEDEDDAMGKAFVRGGGANSDDAIYRLKGTGGKKKLSDMDRLMEEMKQKESAEKESFLQPPMKKKRREMDLLVEEIKSREPTLPTVDEIGPVKGSFDHGDPDTTNLYVGNLAPTVTEEALERVFGKFGRIFSVKVMWPRTEEEKSRRRMSGFVSFYERRAADDARVHLNDSELDGQRIVVGWGKAVKIEATPSPFGNMPTALSPAPVPVTAAPVGPTATTDRPKIVVQIPRDERLRKLIDRLATYVAKDGEEFEVAVRFREAGNPQYAFLEELQSEAAVYYRWRVFSFAMGDSDHKWREVPFQMTMNGPVWVPPPVPSTDRSAHRGTTREPHAPSRSRSRARGKSPRRGRSRSSSRSRSRGSSRPRSRRRSRSGSRDRRYRRSRSRSRSCSSEDSSYDRRRRASRSRSRARDSARTSDSGRSSSRRDTRRRSRSPSRSRSPYNRRDDPVLKKDESLLTGQQLARARDLERGREPNRLPREEHDRFVDLLDTITLERESIKQAMGCALDNSESAVELVHMIRKRFHREDVSAVQLIGYLYVASDLLHNSSAAVKNASLFRTTFQECLPEIVDRLRRVHRAIQGRMSANAMRDKVLSVLTAWESWSLFPPHYLVGLNATFMRKVEEDVYVAQHTDELGPEQLNGVDEEKLRKACAQAGILSSGNARALLARLQWLKEFTAPASAVKKPLAVPVIAVKAVMKEDKDDGVVEPMGEDSVQDDVDGEPMEEEDEKVLVKPSAAARERDEDGEEDLDGEPLDETGDDDLDGVPLDETEPQAEEDFDGEPLDEEDVDGEPLDEEEDLDGEPV